MGVAGRTRGVWNRIFNDFGTPVLKGSGTPKRKPHFSGLASSARFEPIYKSKSGYVGLLEQRVAEINFAQKLEF